MSGPVTEQRDDPRNVEVCVCGHYRFVHKGEEMSGRCAVRAGKFNACRCDEFRNDANVR